LTIGEDYGQGYEYSWLNGDTTYLECTDCAVQTVRPLQDPSYVFTVTDTLGCYISEENYIICVNPEFTVDVPDMFTPNGDGVNDLVTIDGWGIKNLLEFKIYNRWGELVFETTDITQGWDGTYKGELQNVEVFIYTITVEYYENGGTGNKTGNITLMR
jgi:gliding motility-associated-like protein